MIEELIELDIVQVNTPWDFRARVKTADTTEHREFQELFNRINSHFNNEQMLTPISYSHTRDEICAGKSPKDKKWHRVRVEQTLSTKSGPQTSCFFVDDGRVELIPVQWLKHLPETFRNVPFQVKKFALHDLQPLSMVISAEDLTSKVRPVMKWDTSAIDFMKKRIAVSTSVKAVIKSVGQDEEGTIYVHLYLELNQGLTYLNDDLIMFNFATNKPEEFENGTSYGDLPSSTAALTKRPTIEEMINLKAKRLEQKSLSSKSKAARNLDPEDLVYASEPELYLSSKPNKNYNCQSQLDKGYNTDTGELKIPHRRNKVRNLDLEHDLLMSQVQGQGRTDSFVQVHSKVSPRSHQDDDAMLVSLARNHLKLSSGGKSKAANSEQTTSKSVTRSVADDNRTSFSDLSSTSEKLILSGSKLPVKNSSPQSSISAHSPFQKLPLPGRGAVLNSGFKTRVSLDRKPGKRLDIQDSVCHQARTSVFDSSSPVSPRILFVASDKKTAHSVFEMSPANDGYSFFQDPKTPSMQTCLNEKCSASVVSSSPEIVEKSPQLLKLETSRTAVDKSPPDGFRSTRSNSSSSECGMQKTPVGRGAVFKALNEKLMNKSNSLLEIPQKTVVPQSILNIGRGRNISLSSEVDSDDSLSSHKFQQPGYTSGTESTFTGEFVFKKARLPKQATLTGKQTSPTKREDLLKAKTIKPLITEVETSALDGKLTTRPAGSDSTDRQSHAHKPQVGITEILSQEDRDEMVLKTNELRKKMESKFVGDKILKSISPNVRPTSEGKKSSKQARPPGTSGMFGVQDNVVVHGNRPSRPSLKFTEAHLSEQVRQFWNKKDYPSPTLIQAYTWPAVTSGRHVVSISPVNTGKTYAYLLPLLSYLSEPKMYEEIPTGNGPYIIILVSSWKKAELVYYDTFGIADGHPKMRTVIAHGGGQEEKQACNLLNGCEILIVTVPCLKRLIDKRYTDLSRLCHLVVDDAHDVLENFTMDVKEIMENYMSVIKKLSSQLEAPRQFLLFGNRWSDAIDSFMKVYLVDPVLIITSIFEAAVYGKVKQETHMCKISQKIRRLTDLLEVIQDEDSKTIIFCSSKEDIISVSKILTSCSLFSLVAHQDMDLYEIKHVAEQWSTSSLLVSCDEYVMDLKITDAKTVIHYDMPDSKTKFCNRLSCLRKYFRNFSKDTSQTASGSEVITPTSHLIISEDCGLQIKSIVELLKRSNHTVPVKMKAMLAGVQQGQDEDMERMLCPYMLAFGFCRNRLRCNNRHLVFPELDAPEESNWMPDEGEVKVLVTHIIDANHCFVRLLSVRHEGHVTDMSPAYVALQMDLMQWYCNPSNRIRQTAPFAGELCGYKENDNYFRVEVLDILEMNRHEKGSTMIKAEVKFIDSGRVDDIPAHKLFVLPPQLKAVPYQAIEAYVCRVKPMDGDMEWTPMAYHFIYKLMHGKTLEGKIVLRLGYILWLDPLVERIIHPDTGTVINKSYIHSELKNNGLADENPEHLGKLYKICEGKVKISKALLKKTKCAEQMDAEFLPKSQIFHDILVSSVAEPDLFFIQRRHTSNRLEDLMEEVNKFMSGSQAPKPNKNLTIGKFCLAEYMTFDCRWYRGQITRVEEDRYQVFFVDYGDKDMVSKDKVCELPKDKFQDLPLQAVECRLAGIMPTGASWDELAGDALWDLSHFVNGDMKGLVAKVVSTETSNFAGKERYVVDLFNTKDDLEDININQELVWRQVAAAEAENTSFTDLFSKSLRSRGKVYSSALEKVHDLCAAIYWEETPSKALYIAQEMLSILTSALSDNEFSEQVWNEAASGVVKLVSRVRWANTHMVILDCVSTLSRVSDRLSETMIGAGCISLIISCLEMNSESTVQYHAAESIARMASSSTRFKTAFELEENLSVLEELLESTQSEQVQGALCKAFTAVCTGSDSVCEHLLGTGVTQRLSKYLTNSASHQTSESIILLLSALTTLDSSHSELKRESLMDAIVKTLSKSDCDKCIQHCVQLCDNFAALRRKHKTFLLEHQMVPVLTRVLQLHLSSTTRQMCKDLLSSLVVKVPSEPMSGHSLRAEEHTRAVISSSNSGVPPPVSWSQNIYVVIVSVKVNGVIMSDDMVTIDNNTVTFRTTVEGINYFFTYQLYDTILPVKSRVMVKPSEVLISMRKVEKGKWPRLLQQKQKPVNLSVDYERFLDSSSEDDVCDDDKPFILKQKKTKLPIGTNAPKSKLKRAEGETTQYSDSSDSSDSLENVHDDVQGDWFEL